jgi:hypothetical protein
MALITDGISGRGRQLIRVHDWIGSVGRMFISMKVNVCLTGTVTPLA